MTRSCRCGCGQALTAIETAPRTGGRTVVSLSMSPVRTDTHQPVFRMCLRVCEYPGPSSAEWEGWADGGGRAAKSEGHSRPVRAGGGWSSLRWWKGIDPTQAFQQVAQVGPLTARPAFPRCPLLPGRGTHKDLQPHSPLLPPLPTRPTTRPKDSLPQSTSSRPLSSLRSAAPGQAQHRNHKQLDPYFAGDNATLTCTARTRANSHPDPEIQPGRLQLPTLPRGVAVLWKQKQQ